MSEWRSIRSAPKDGSYVLVGWRDKDGAWVIRCARWDDEFALARYIERTDRQIYHKAWTDYRVQSFGYEEYQEYHPTHWMPLPSPPEAK